MAEGSRRSQRRHPPPSIAQSPTPETLPGRDSEVTPTTAPTPTATPELKDRIAFSSNGDVFVINADGSSLTDLASLTSIQDPVPPAWSPDGGRIAFEVGVDGGLGSDIDIHVVNMGGSGLTNLTNNPASDTSPSWSADGTKIAFTSDRDGDSEIYVMTIDGSGVRRLTNNSARDNAPSWSPDGSLIRSQYFTCTSLCRFHGVKRRLRNMVRADSACRPG